MALDAQVKAADFTARLFWVGVAQAVLGVLGTGAILWTLHATRQSAKAAVDSVKIARKAFEAEKRPWLKIDLIENGNVETVENGFFCNFTANVVNVTDSPALEAQIVAVVVASKFRECAPVHWQKEMILTEAAPGDDGVTIFGGEATIYGRAPFIKMDELAHNIFTLVGAVRYKSRFDDTLYHTGFIKFIVPAPNHPVAIRDALVHFKGVDFQRHIYTIEGDTEPRNTNPYID